LNVHFEILELKNAFDSSVYFGLKNWFANLLGNRIVQSAVRVGPTLTTNFLIFNTLVLAVT